MKVRLPTNKLKPNNSSPHSLIDLAIYLLESDVVCIPGSKFERPNHLRIAYASSSLEEIEKGCEALSAALLRLEVPTEQK
jgi:aspartate/methionine/tyrosine aminotransferase